MAPVGTVRGAGIVAAGLVKRYRGIGGDLVPALEGLSFEVPAGSIACLLGPTGCGKTTALRLVAGLEAPDAGRIALAGLGAPSPAPGAGVGVGFLTQHHSLLPWLTVRENVALPLRVRGAHKAEAGSRADGILEPLGLAPFAALYPYELSGGMQQRAAMGRLLASEASFWLLDEPFGALDERSRHRLQDLLVECSRARGLTVLFVTHAIDEAVYLADTIHLLSAAPGRIVRTWEVARPRPRSRLEPWFGTLLEEVRRRLEETLV